jgi:translation initiation factor IF-1
MAGFSIGVVIEGLPGGMWRVRLVDEEPDGEELTAHVAEEFRRVSSPVRPGDRVKIRRAQLDPRRATIVGRAT